MPIYIIVTFLDIDIGEPSSVFLQTVSLNTKRLGGVTNLRVNGAFAPTGDFVTDWLWLQTNSVTCWTEDTNPWS
jgi:hypothetical protein